MVTQIRSYSMALYKRMTLPSGMFKVHRSMHLHTAHITQKGMKKNTLIDLSWGDREHGIIKQLQWKYIFQTIEVIKSFYMKDHSLN